jgi:hypothetical protein
MRRNPTAGGWSVRFPVPVRRPAKPAISDLHAPGDVAADDLERVALAMQACADACQAAAQALRAGDVEAANAAIGQVGGTMKAAGAVAQPVAGRLETLYAAAARRIQAQQNRR